MADALGAVNSIVMTEKQRQTGGMKFALILFAPLVLLVCCAPVSVYYQQGVPASRLKNDHLSCQVDALSKAPVAAQIKRAPPQYIPSRSYCRSDGHCSHRGGFFVEGQVYTIDVNARLRSDLEVQCMGNKGYIPVELPKCTGDQLVEDKPRGMPALTETSCVQKDDAGAWQVVEPGA